jgi:hypothetical protein
MVAITLGAVLCSCVSPEIGRRQFATYTEADALGGWFGFAQGDVYLYRIVLSAPTSAGEGAVCSRVTGKVSRFDIKEWRVAGANGLDIEVSAASELQGIKGLMITQTMFEGVIYGRSGWSNTVTFYKEGPFEARMRALRKETTR